MTDDAHDNVEEEFDEDINTTAPQEKPPSAWSMPEPVFRRTSGKLPGGFEKNYSVAEVDESSADSVETSETEPKPKSPTLKIVILAIAILAMIAFLIVFLTVIYFMFLRSNGMD